MPAPPQVSLCPPSPWRASPAALRHCGLKPSITPLCRSTGLNLVRAKWTHTVNTHTEPSFLLSSHSSSRAFLSSAGFTGRGGVLLFNCHVGPPDSSPVFPPWDQCCCDKQPVAQHCVPGLTAGLQRSAQYQRGRCEHHHGGWRYTCDGTLRGRGSEWGERKWIQCRMMI